ncbi:MAG: hypothetical protein C3F02_00475 [Parcubacteria group bacterium]|nr:MAG: hypothetical protein C3F02_00475 [Parcubacteria group bacterium]
MNTQNIWLLIAAAVNLLMCLIILSRGVKNSKINLYFSLVAFFTFLWTCVLIIPNLGVSYELIRFSEALSCPTGLLIIVCLYMFILNFPYKSFDISKRTKIFLASSVLWTIVFYLFFYQFSVPNIEIAPDHVIASFEWYSYTLFTLNFLILVFMSIVLLVKKYRTTDGIYKSQLKFILAAVIIGALVSSYANLLLVYAYDVRYTHLGPLSTLLINFVVFYFIFSPKEKTNA